MIDGQAGRYQRRIDITDPVECSARRTKAYHLPMPRSRRLRHGPQRVVPPMRLQRRSGENIRPLSAIPDSRRHRQPHTLPPTFVLYKRGRVNHQAWRTRVQPLTNLKWDQAA